MTFSIAGRRKGFDDTRGTLFFEIARLAQSKRPSYLLLENVPGLLSHDKGRTFSVILATLNDLGYHVEWTVLNSKHFGVPQSRRRLFIIGYLDPRCAGKILPVFGTGGKALIQVLGGPQGSRVYDADGVACTQTAGAGGVGGKTGLYIIPQDRPFVDLCAGRAARQTDAARCLTARYGQTTLSNHRAERSGVLLIKEATKKGYKEANPGDSVDLGFSGSNTRRGRVGQDIAHTLETSCIQGIVERGGRIRRLMPRECLRLHGFDEWQIDRILAIQSDAQAYKQAGNSVTANVIEAIGRRIREVECGTESRCCRMIGLKDQCFGVEVEMTGITREQAATALAAYFATDARYVGGAYDKWCVTDRDGKEWTVMSDSSIHGEQKIGSGYRATGDYRYRVEMVTPKLTYAELPKLQECVRQVRHAGAKANSSCGIHVHVDAANHNRQSLKNLIGIMYSKGRISCSKRCRSMKAGRPAGARRCGNPC